ncbi:MAG: hypothetical protein LBU12_09515 [Deltaproteobacteria bacterium]|jgi:type IV pilus assembly protein PilQ|nr:hypothetical protein [Deltaproteobacteria bacterium]
MFFLRRVIVRRAWARAFGLAVKSAGPPASGPARRLAPKRLAALLGAALAWAGPAAAALDFVPEELVQSDVKPSAAPAVLSPGEAGAATAPTGPAEGGAAPAEADTLISLDFQNADLRALLRLVGEVAGKNVLLSDQASGKVTVKLDKTPWREALDLILGSRNLVVIDNGTVLRIDTLDAAQQARSDVVDSEASQALVKKVFTPKYAPVAALAEKLDKAKSRRGRVRVAGRDVVVEDDLGALQALAVIFSRHDRPAQQALIKARLVEASAEFVEALGLRWGCGSAGGSAGASDEPSLSAWRPAAAPAVCSGLLGPAASLALEAQLDAAESLGRIRTVASRRLTADDDQEVYLREIAQSPQAAPDPYERAPDAGPQFVELRLTPHLGEDGRRLSLDLALSRSGLGASLLSHVDGRSALAKIPLQQGQIAFVGGVQDAAEVKPLTDWLFPDRALAGLARTELLIFIAAAVEDL